MKYFFLPFLCFLGGVHVGIAQSYTTFEKTSTGLQYKIFKKGGTIKPKLGDILNCNIAYANDIDSLLFDSRKQTVANIFELKTPTFKGSLEEGLLLMSKGDSAVFLLITDSVYSKVFKMEMPKLAKKGSKMKFFVKLLDIKSGEERERYLAQLKDDTEKALLYKKENEQLEINKFLALNDLNVVPTASGLYYIEKEPGNGFEIKTNEKVKVVYNCTLLDGTLIDSHLYDPIEFVTGAKKILPGLEEGILLMKRGTKATLIIPSWLAFGEKQISNIKPYSTLIYDIEVKQ